MWPGGRRQGGRGVGETPQKRQVRQNHYNIDPPPKLRKFCLCLCLSPLLRLRLVLVLVLDPCPPTTPKTDPSNRRPKILPLPGGSHNAERSSLAGPPNSWRRWERIGPG